MEPSPLSLLTALIGALGALVTVYYSSRAVKAKIVADRGERELAGVKVSVDSLQAALARSDADNIRLRADLEALRVQCREEQRINDERIAALTQQIRSLGGEP